jgi:hypothetical protein
MILKGKSLGFTLSEITDIFASQGEPSGKMDLEMGLLPEQITAQIASNASAAKLMRRSKPCARPIKICSNYPSEARARIAPAGSRNRSQAAGQRMLSPCP